MRFWSSRTAAEYVEKPTRFLWVKGTHMGRDCELLDAVAMVATAYLETNKCDDLPALIKLIQTLHRELRLVRDDETLPTCLRN